MQIKRVPKKEFFGTEISIETLKVSEQCTRNAEYLR